MSQLSCIIDPNCTVPMANEGFIGPQNLVQSHDWLNLSNQSQLTPNWWSNNGTNSPELDSKEALEILVVLASLVLILNIVQMLVKVINFLFQSSNHVLNKFLEGSAAEVKRGRRKTRKEFADNTRSIVQDQVLSRKKGVNANRKLKQNNDNCPKSHTNSECSSNDSDKMEYWTTQRGEGPVWCHCFPRNRNLESRSAGQMTERKVGQRDEKEGEKALIKLEHENEGKSERLGKKSRQRLPQNPDQTLSGRSQSIAGSPTMKKSQYKRNTQSDAVCKSECSSTYTRYYRPDKKRGMKKRVVAGKLKGKVARLKAGGEA